MSFPYPDEPTTVKAFQEGVRRAYTEFGFAFPDPKDEDAYRHFVRYGYSCRSMPEPEAANKHIRELREALMRKTGRLPSPRSTEPGTPTQRPLVGPLRVVNKLFHDDTGPRRVFFCSWFPALRILRDHPAEFARQLDAIAAAGYQGIRVFLAVGGWTDFWDGREVAPVPFVKWHWTGNHLRSDRLGHAVPAWPDYDEVLRTLLAACRARALRLYVTTGDAQILFPTEGQKAAEVDLHRRLARICAEQGGTEVVAMAEATNEYPINRLGSDSAASRDQMGRLLQVWKDAIPGVLTAQGAPLSEEPAKLLEAAEYGNLCTVHISRDPYALCLKRSLGVVYWEGNYRAFKTAFLQGEPKPAGAHRDATSPTNDPAEIVALYAMHALTGQASVYFNGPAVRSFDRLESTWGFRELPALFDAHLPEDVALWDHGANRPVQGVEYWWKGDQFVTVLYREWNPAPPRPIASWTLYSGDNVTYGTGTPPPMTGLLVGRFAA